MGITKGWRIVLVPQAAHRRDALRRLAVSPGRSKSGADSAGNLRRIGGVEQEAVDVDQGTRGEDPEGGCGPGRLEPLLKRYHRRTRKPGIDPGIRIPAKRLRDFHARRTGEAEAPRSDLVHALPVDRH